MTWIALLRAVNVGGKNIVRMAELRALAEAAGCTEVRSLLQSGNLVFGGGGTTAAAIERTLESATAKRLGVTTEFVVRSAKEWKALVAANPFPGEAKRDPAHLLVVCLKAAPKAAAVKALRDAIRGREVVEVVGRQVYAVYPDGVGRSKLTAALIDRKLDTRGTARNWNTVLKLTEMAGA
jgi:uncharacterized protein (DUF1697 family)